ncbi:DUF4350 domain-containing protein [Mycolicibacterium austroafricanum]|uniref:DUF4350 domain-containing protein n=1 Tax=Mycolicibacterium austroafricanum TaxID=39687 RepID=UPI000CF9CF1F|nr:DUF4350 domain-containing protein [Mycolicibacterium austroafricanum]PQP50853.1 hypothetical protein C6A88_09265 [Mycolicibacterium austroafricanum]QRZ06529.1 DUF4350 domain-containing protein [Mycolicibacterium austroafricanum]QZT68013.1 DUF4350 domain-containing protein [Mycolicibacterium austroafricanum]
MSTAVGATITDRWRGLRWALAAVVAIVAVAALTTWLTAPRPGGHLDPTSTSSDGVLALMTLLREHGVTVVEAASIADVEREAREDTLVVAAQTYHLYDDDQLRRLAAAPGDRLLIAPIGKTREELAPELRRAETTEFGGLAPDCDLREANRAGTVQFGIAETYEAQGSTAVTRCYDGVLARYTDDGRTITVVGSEQFLMNAGLAEEGNAALAMNLAGTHPRMIWYAPQRSEGGESGGAASLTDLIPAQVYWMVLQLTLAVALLAWWKGRRVGPLVAEALPVVVRASETAEGRGRLYRSRRARDVAAESLRTATRQRMLPRLGLTPGAPPEAVSQAVAARCGLDPQTVAHTLYGQPPDTDADLVTLARALDDIERQVAQS